MTPKHRQPDSSAPGIGAGFVFRAIGVAILFLAIGLVAMWVFYSLRGARPTAGPATVGALEPLPPLLPAQPTAPNRIRLFYTGDGVLLAPEIREIVPPNSVYERAQAILNAYLEGPQSATLRSPLPASVKLQALYIRDDAAYLDFGPELRTELTGGFLAESLGVYGLVNSLLLNVPELKKASILINGQPVETLGGLDLSAPLVENVALIARDTSAS